MKVGGMELRGPWRRATSHTRPGRQALEKGVSPFYEARGQPLTKMAATGLLSGAFKATKEFFSNTLQLPHWRNPSPCWLCDAKLSTSKPGKDVRDAGHLQTGLLLHHEPASHRAPSQQASFVQFARVLFPHGSWRCTCTSCSAKGSTAIFWVHSALPVLVPQPCERQSPCKRESSRRKSEALQKAKSLQKPSASLRLNVWPSSSSSSKTSTRLWARRHG